LVSFSRFHATRDCADPERFFRGHGKSFAGESTPRDLLCWLNTSALLHCMRISLRCFFLLSALPKMARHLRRPSNDRNGRPQQPDGEIMRKIPWRAHAVVAGMLCAAASLFATNALAETPPELIRFGVSNAGVGSPPRISTGWTAVAQQRAYLEDEFKNDKVKIEWIFFKGQGPAVNEALSNTQLDFTTLGDLPAIVGRSVGVRAHLLMVTGRSNTYVAVKPESTIRSLKDLRGKRIGLHKGTATQLAANRALEQAGLSEKDVKIVNLEPAASLAAFNGGDLDAIFGSNSLLPLRDKGLARIVYSTRDLPTNNGQGHILVHDDFSAKYPETTTRVVKALLRAAQYTADERNREEVFKLWSSAGSVSEANYREEYADIPLAQRTSPLFDAFAIARNKQSIEEAFRYKLIRKKFDVNSWIDRRFLDAALKELQLQSYWPQFDANGKLVDKKRN
jgi:sulfonate transport system substrate-binding protein